MSYVAQKQMRLSGHEYMPGEVIDSKHLLPGRIRALVRNGRITEIAETAATLEVAEGYDGKIVIPIVQDGGTDAETAEVLSVPLTEGDVQQIFAVMQMTVDEAAKEIEGVQSEDVLIVLHAADSRQGVKKAAKKQAEKLAAEAATEQTEEQAEETVEESAAEADGQTEG